MAYHKVAEHRTAEGKFGVVKLFQSDTATKRFKVTYGMQSKSGLTYDEACTEYGACVFHALSCAGIIDNNGE